jgi:hypothetical protein
MAVRTARYQRSSGCGGALLVALLGGPAAFVRRRDYESGSKQHDDRPNAERIWQPYQRSDHPKHDQSPGNPTSPGPYGRARPQQAFFQGATVRHGSSEDAIVEVPETIDKAGHTFIVGEEGTACSAPYVALAGRG